jgi:hypothetical protein
VELVSGNIFLRPMEFAKAGDSIIGHAHNFDHTTYVPRGALRFELVEPLTTFADGTVATWNVLKTVEKRAVDPRNWALIRAHAYHRITALEDDSRGHCIYSHRIPQGLVALQGKVSAEYDALLARLIAMANEKFGDIVQEDDGWEPSRI